MRVWRDLAAEKPMVFMAGPRQTAKTTLAQMISGEFSKVFHRRCSGVPLMADINENV
jgi:predicted AAA+ superfamily ATPase